MTNPAVIDGVDVDTVAAAVRGCPSVDDLYSSTTALVASYLPGRQVAGVRVDGAVVTVQVRSRWGVPVAEVATQIRGAVASHVQGRRVDVVVADLADPPDTGAVGGAAALDRNQEGEPIGWTTTGAGDGGHSSAATIPTVVETRPPS